MCLNLVCVEEGQSDIIMISQSGVLKKNIYYFLSYVPAGALITCVCVCVCVFCLVQDWIFFTSQTFIEA